MPCNMIPCPDAQTAAKSSLQAPGASEQKTGPISVVSNAPETISDPQGSIFPNPATLFKASINLQAGDSKWVRPYLWHNNLNLSTRYIALLLRATSFGLGSATIGGFVEEYGLATSGSQYLDLGICLAEVHLYSKWGPFVNVPQLSPQEQVYFAQPIDAGTLLGAVMEFNIASPVAASIDLRVVATTSLSSLGQFSDPAVSPENPHNGKIHVRGIWDWSFAQFPTNRILNADPLIAPQEQYCSICTRDGLEEAVWGPKIYTDPPTLVNRGEYGENLRYRFGVVNLNKDLPGGVLCLVVSHNDITVPNYVPIYGGAGQLVGAIANPGTVIPAIQRVNGVPSRRIDGGVGFGVPANTTVPIDVIIEIANAGNATLPVHLLLVSTTIV